MLPLPLRTQAALDGPLPAGLLKVLELKEAEIGRYPRESTALLIRQVPGSREWRALESQKWGAIVCPNAVTTPISSGIPIIHSINNPEVVKAGDVIRLGVNQSVLVLFRRGANANSLFVTDRCNSRCLMCSQPSRESNDGISSAEALALIPLIDDDLTDLGITGGEPTLLGEDLVSILTACKHLLPYTKLHVLTNGRRLADAYLAAKMAAVGHPAITWAVPLYADVPARHDYVVQSTGAFEEAMAGIYNLVELGQAIEVRFVVSAQTVGRLPQFAEFIWRNLPFVRHVAFMGLEPVGYARANRALLWIDPADCGDLLQAAVLHLAARGIRVSLYNMPLCVLPPTLWPFARQSISDWKSVYTEECAMCGVNSKCGGFFASAGPEWRSRVIGSIGLESAWT